MKIAETVSRPLVVWTIQDGKPGHENQIRGLVEALSRRVGTEVHRLQAPGKLVAIGYGLRSRFPPAAGLPDPDLIIGAGHGTHLALLAARRARGGRAIVLMQPSLPCRWFDLCVIPAHDRPEPGPGVVVTRGVLNPMRPAAVKDPRQGLLLMGGPSKHYRWDEPAVIDQIRFIVDQKPDVHWTLSTSRRTPAGFLSRLTVTAANLSVAPVEETAPGWLAGRLAETAWVWVTPDSVSMIYESLTAGAAVGLLELAPRGETRVTRGVNLLEKEGKVLRFSEWREKPRLELPKEAFNEAERCAGEILRRWPVSD